MLENLYGDKSSDTDREEKFQKWVQVYDDANNYSLKKKMFYTRFCKEPEAYRTSKDFRRRWMEGFWKGFRVVILEFDDWLTHDLDELEAAVLKKERVLRAANDGTYGTEDGIKSKSKKKEEKDKAKEAADKQKHQKTKPEKPHCKYFAEGKCNKGNACPFKHEKQKGMVDTQQPRNPPSQNSSNQQNQKDLSYLKKKCTRNHKNTSIQDHPAFACKDENTMCSSCKQNGHTADLCPKRKCTVTECTKNHATRVHGFSENQFFQNGGQQGAQLLPPKFIACAGGGP